MGSFKGHALSQTRENHVFIINDPLLQSYGIGSLTLLSFNQINSLSASSPLKQYVDFKTFVTTIAGVSGEYFQFNGTSYTKQTITYVNLETLIKYHESGDSLAPAKKKEINDKLISDIQNSLDRCVSFGNGKIKCYLYDLGKRHNDRIVTNKGAPVITAVPRRSTGARYGARNTLEAQSSSTGIGSYIVPSPELENDISNTVTAPLKISYNANTGMFESGNQILARLLTDVESAQVIGLDIPEAQLSGVFQNTDFYDAGGSMYMGQFTIGTAMPLSLEGGNPHMLGPNFIQSGDNKRIEKIRIVNRSARSFKKGAIVICSHIDGEWIVQDFGSSDLTVTPQPATVGRWGFAKFIANSDWFFRTEDGNQLFPADCLDMLKTKFFSSPTFTSNATRKQLGDLNNPKAKIYNLNYYIQTSITDHTAKNEGGNNTDTLYSKINYDQAKIINDTPTYNTMPLFWGPVFPEGYLSKEYGRIKATTATMKSMSTGGAGFFNPASVAVSTLAKLDEKFVELPAELATNGSYEGNGFPTEDYNIVIGAINSVDFAKEINNWKGKFAEWLGDSNGKDVYGMRPTNPLRLQFSALSAELAGADDKNSNNVQNVYTNYNSDRRFTEAMELLTGKQGVKFFGELYKRMRDHGLADLITIDSTPCYVYNSAIGRFEGIPYDCYIKKTPLNRPRAAPYMFNDTDSQTMGSNTVGIITARNKFSKRGGGNMTISADQVTGLVGPAIGGAFSNPILTILPIGGGIGWSTDTGPTMQRRYLSIWGSTVNDAIYSFGTTALHVMVWDYWPPEQTVFIPQYFTVLHFNEGSLFSAASTKLIKIMNSQGQEKDVTVDEITYKDLDFRIPSTQIETAQGITIEILQPNSFIGRDQTNKLADQDNWKVDTSLRGQLVTDGIYYYKNSIGLYKGNFGTGGPAWSIKTAGSKFEIDDIINLSRGVSIRITGVDPSGGITDFSFNEKELPNGLKNTQRGIGFTNGDFEGQDGYLMTIPNTRDGQSATISFLIGVCYRFIEFKDGPKQRTPITRLTSSSGEGKRRVWETKETVLSLESNSGSTYAGEYEAFFFFHNDIGHVFQQDMIENNPNYVQYVTISIS